MKLKFNVTGMTCAACSARVEKVTSQIPGVRKAEVNLLSGSMTVEADSAQVAEPIRAAGYAPGAPKCLSPAFLSCRCPGRPDTS